MRKPISIILLVGLLLVLTASSTPAAAGNPDILHEAVSRFRVANDLSGSILQQTTPEAPPVIQTATPEADGAVVHTVQAGESLFIIAQAYQVNPYEIIQLNNLPQDPVLYPGDRLLIFIAPTVTPTIPVTSTPTMTRTPRPTRTPVPVPSRTPTRQATATLVPVSPTPATRIAGMVVAWDKIDPVLVAIGLLGLGGVVLIGVGSLLKRGNR